MKHAQQKRIGLTAAILVVMALTAGIALGLILGWIGWPVRFMDTSIAKLSPEDKDEYMFLVASAYLLDGDLEKAQERLARLELPNVNQSLVALIDRCMLEGREERRIQTLISLADSLGIATPRMLAYLYTPTPLATDTPLPTPTPLPTDTPTATPVPPTDTAVPSTDTPQPTDTVTVPTDTARPPTDTPRPQATKTPKPQPTNTPQPTSLPAPTWTWSVQLLGPAIEPAQSCTGGAQYIRVTVIDAQGSQLGGIWIHDMYTGHTEVTGHKGDDPYWGPGEAEIPCPGDSGAAVCIASDQSGTCVSDYTRGMSCLKAPSFEDLWAAGYCECCEAGISKERCQQYYSSGAACMMQNRHYSWHATFKRSW